MPSAQSDVAYLLRVKAAREKGAALAVIDGARSRRIDPAKLKEAAKSRWPASVESIGALVDHYQARSEALGVSVTLQEIPRLRLGFPDLLVHFSRDDGRLATKVVFRMSRDGDTYCRIAQTIGRPQANLNRDDRLIDMSDRHLQPLFKAIVQILIVQP